MSQQKIGFVKGKLVSISASDSPSVPASPAQPPPNPIDDSAAPYQCVPVGSLLYKINDFDKDYVLDSKMQKNAYQKCTLLEATISKKGEVQFKVQKVTENGAGDKLKSQSRANFCSETHFTALEQLFGSVRSSLGDVRHCREVLGDRVLRCSIKDFRISPKDLESQLAEKGALDLDLLQIQREEQEIVNGSLTGSPIVKPKQYMEFTMDCSEDTLYASKDFSFFARIQRRASCDAIASIQTFREHCISRIKSSVSRHRAPEKKQVLLTEADFQLIAIVSVLQMLQKNHKLSLKKVRDLTTQRKPLLDDWMIDKAEDDFFSCLLFFSEVNFDNFVLPSGVEDSDKQIFKEAHALVSESIGSFLELFSASTCSTMLNSTEICRFFPESSSGLPPRWFLEWLCTLPFVGIKHDDVAVEALWLKVKSKLDNHSSNLAIIHLRHEIEQCAYQGHLEEKAGLIKRLFAAESILESSIKNDFVSECTHEWHCLFRLLRIEECAMKIKNIQTQVGHRLESLESEPSYALLNMDRTLKKAFTKLMSVDPFCGESEERDMDNDPVTLAEKMLEKAEQKWSEYTPVADIADERLFCHLHHVNVKLDDAFEEIERSQSQSLVEIRSRVNAFEEQELDGNALDTITEIRRDLFLLDLERLGDNTGGVQLDLKIPKKSDEPSIWSDYEAQIEEQIHRLRFDVSESQEVQGQSLSDPGRKRKQFLDLLQKVGIVLGFQVTDTIAFPPPNIDWNAVLDIAGDLNECCVELQSEIEPNHEQHGEQTPWIQFVANAPQKDMLFVVIRSLVRQEARDVLFPDEYRNEDSRRSAFHDSQMFLQEAPFEATDLENELKVQSILQKFLVESRQLTLQQFVDKRMISATSVDPRRLGVENFVGLPPGTDKIALQQAFVQKWQKLKKNKFEGRLCLPPTLQQLPKYDDYFIPVVLMRPPDLNDLEKLDKDLEAAIKAFESRHKTKIFLPGGTKSKRRDKWEALEYAYGLFPFSAFPRRDEWISTLRSSEFSDESIPWWKRQGYSGMEPFPHEFAKNPHQHPQFWAFISFKQETEARNPFDVYNVNFGKGKREPKVIREGCTRSLSTIQEIAIKEYCWLALRSIFDFLKLEIIPGIDYTTCEYKFQLQTREPGKTKYVVDLKPLAAMFKCDIYNNVVSRHELDFPFSKSIVRSKDALTAYVIDHIFPFAYGGLTVPQNLQILQHYSNKIKSASDHTPPCDLFLGVSASILVDMFVYLHDCLWFEYKYSSTAENQTFDAQVAIHQLERDSVEAARNPAQQFALRRLEHILCYDVSVSAFHCFDLKIKINLAQSDALKPFSKTGSSRANHHQFVIAKGRAAYQTILYAVYPSLNPSLKATLSADLASTSYYESVTNLRIHNLRSKPSMQ
jgi:hypothetical protein